MQIGLFDNAPLCACGCGGYVTRHYRGKRWNKIIRNHSGIGSANNNWKGGITIDGYGYALIRINGIPTKRSRVVMEQKLGRKLKRCEVVHHKNEIKDDDSPDNLELFPSQKEHIRFHTIGKVRTDETRLKMSKAQKGHSVSNETKNKISNALKGHSYNKGHRHSEETKKKQSISALRRREREKLCQK